MNPQNNSTPINIGNRKMVWVWIALIGGFVIILLLAAILFYQSQKDISTNQQINSKESNEKVSEVTPVDEKIVEEVTNIDIGDLETDFQDVEKDINQL